MLADVGAIHREAYREEIELVDLTVRSAEALRANLKHEQRKFDESRRRLTARLERFGLDAPERNGADPPCRLRALAPEA